MKKIITLLFVCSTISTIWGSHLAPKGTFGKRFSSLFKKTIKPPMHDRRSPDDLAKQEQQDFNKEVSTLSLDDKTFTAYTTPKPSEKQHTQHISQQNPKSGDSAINSPVSSRRGSINASHDSAFSSQQPSQASSPTLLRAPSRRGSIKSITSDNSAHPTEKDVHAGQSQPSHPLDSVHTQDPHNQTHLSTAQNTSLVHQPNTNGISNGDYLDFKTSLVLKSKPSKKNPIPEEKLNKTPKEIATFLETLSDNNLADAGVKRLQTKIIKLSLKDAKTIPQIIKLLIVKNISPETKQAFVENLTQELSTQGYDKTIEFLDELHNTLSNVKDLSPTDTIAFELHRDSIIENTLEKLIPKLISPKLISLNILNKLKTSANTLVTLISEGDRSLAQGYLKPLYEQKIFENEIEKINNIFENSQADAHKSEIIDFLNALSEKQCNQLIKHSEQYNESKKQSKISLKEPLFTKIIEHYSYRENAIDLLKNITNENNKIVVAKLIITEKTSQLFTIINPKDPNDPTPIIVEPEIINAGITDFLTNLKNILEQLPKNKENNLLIEELASSLKYTGMHITELDYFKDPAQITTIIENSKLITNPILRDSYYEHFIHPSLENLNMAAEKITVHERHFKNLLNDEGKIKNTKLSPEASRINEIMRDLNSNENLPIPYKETDGFSEKENLQNYGLKLLKINNDIIDQLDTAIKACENAPENANKTIQIDDFNEYKTNLTETNDKLIKFILFKEPTYSEQLTEAIEFVKDSPERLSKLPKQVVNFITKINTILNERPGFKQGDKIENHPTIKNVVTQLIKNNPEESFHAALAIAYKTLLSPKLGDAILNYIHLPVAKGTHALVVTPIQYTKSVITNSIDAANTATNAAKTAISKVADDFKTFYQKNFANKSHTDSPTTQPAEFSTVTTPSTALP